MERHLPNITLLEKELDNGIYTNLFFISKQKHLYRKNKEWKERLKPNINVIFIGQWH